MATIALVDDDRNILTSVSIALESEGYRVDTYTDGSSALDGLTDRPPRPGDFRYQDAADGWDGIAAANAPILGPSSYLPDVEGR